MGVVTAGYALHARAGVSAWAGPVIPSSLLRHFVKCRYLKNKDKSFGGGNGTTVKSFQERREDIMKTLRDDGEVMDGSVNRFTHGKSHFFFFF